MSGNESTLEVDDTEEKEEDEQDVIAFQISNYPADFTLRGYLEKLENESIYVPPFQREYVWDQVRASKLIESFLLGLPVPGVFLYKERKTNRLQIVDGQQRILTIHRFYKGTFGDRAFRLKNVHPRWDGKAYDDLEEAHRLQLDDAVLRAVVIQQLDPDDDSSIYHIFERLNSGGMRLNPMEIRKCVYFGKFVDTLSDLNNTPSWRLIIGQPRPDPRMRDMELVLRILSLAHEWERYEKPMKQFLNRPMVKMKKLEVDRPDEFKELICDIERRFVSTSEYVLASLGPKPFHLRGRLNYAALDSVFCSAFKAGDISPPIFSERYEELKRNDAFQTAVTFSTSDDSVLKARFNLAKKTLLA